MTEQESRRRLDPPLPSFHHSFLSVSLQCLVCPLAVSVNWWLSYTQVTVTLYYAHTAISAINMCACITDWLWMSGAFKGTGIVGFHYVVTKKSFI